MTLSWDLVRRWCFRAAILRGDIHEIDFSAKHYFYYYYYYFYYYYYDYYYYYYYYCHYYYYYYTGDGV